MLLTEAIPLALNKYKLTESLILACKSAGMLQNSGQSKPRLESVTDYMHHVAWIKYLC